MKLYVKGIIKSPFLLELFVDLFCFIQFCSPLTDNLSIYIQIFILLCAILVSPRIDISDILCFAFLLLGVFLRYLSGHSSITGYFSPFNHLIKYVFALEGIICVQAFEELDKGAKRRTLFICLIGILITNTISIYYSFIDPLAIRYRGLRGGSYPGIIKFAQVFAIAIIVMTLILGFATKGKYKKTNIIGNSIMLVTFVSSVVMLVRSQLATPVLLLIIITVLSAVLYFQAKPFVKIVTIGLILTIIFTWQSILEFLDKISSGIKSEFVRLRVEAVLNALLSTGQQTTSLDNRNAKIEISLRTFKQHPIMGAGFANFNENTVGSHQDFFDILAVIGIVGLLIVILIFMLRTVKTFKNPETNKLTFLACVAYFVILGFLDPNLEVSIILATFMISPYIFSLWREESNLLSGGIE